MFGFWATACKTVCGRPMLSVRCLSVCPVLSVTLVYCGQTVGWIKMKHAMEVGIGPGHILLDGDAAPPPQRGTALHCSAHVCCGQTAGCIKMQLGREVSIGPDHIVLDGDPAPIPPPKKGHSPQFSAHVYCRQTVAHLSYC